MKLEIGKTTKIEDTEWQFMNILPSQAEVQLVNRLPNSIKIVPMPKPLV